MSQVFQYSPVIVELGSFVTTAIMYILLYYRWGMFQNDEDYYALNHPILDHFTRNYSRINIK